MQEFEGNWMDGGLERERELVKDADGVWGVEMEGRRRDWDDWKRGIVEEIGKEDLVKEDLRRKIIN